MPIGTLPNGNIGDYETVSGVFVDVSGDFVDVSGDFVTTSGDYETLSGDYATHKVDVNAHHDPTGYETISGDYLTHIADAIAHHDPSGYEAVSGDFLIVSGDYAITSGTVEDYSTLSGDYSSHQGDINAHINASGYETISGDYLTHKADVAAHIDVSGYESISGDYLITSGTVDDYKAVSGDYAITSGTVDDYKNVSGDYVLVSGHLVNLHASGVEMDNNAGTPFTTLQDYLNIIQSAGYFSGGQVTDNGDGSIDIAGGAGFVKTSESVTGAVKTINWDPFSSIALTDQALNFIGIHYNGGTPSYYVVPNTHEDANLYTGFSVARVFKDGTGLHIAQCGIQTNNFYRKTHRRMAEEEYFVRANGLVTTESPERYVVVSEGAFWRGLNRFTTKK